MLVNKAVHFAMLTAAVLLDSTTDGAVIKICGRQLGDYLVKFCKNLTNPPWNVPTVVEQPSVVDRNRRGIADECCIAGCSANLIAQYCAFVRGVPETPLEHIIADRSAELGGLQTKDASPARAVSFPVGHAKNAVHRAAPVVGTVSPLITWGRTLNTDPSASRTNYAYVVYSH